MFLPDMIPPAAPSPVYLSVIVVAGYKRKYLPECVESICASHLDRSHYEVLLAWGFDAPDWEERFRALGVRVLRCPSGLSEGEILYQAIPQARGDVLVFIEDDDTFLPEKLDHVEALFRARPGLAFYNHDERAIDEQGKVLGWIHSVNGFNLSSHSIRAAILRPHIAALRRMIAASDHYIYWVGRLFGEETLHEGKLLTGYRMHAANFHVGKDFTPDYAWMVALAKEARRQGRPVTRDLLRLTALYALLRATRILLPDKPFFRMFRLYSRIAWLREIRSVMATGALGGHPSGRPLLATV